MSLLFFDGFDHYNTTTQAVLKGWNSCTGSFTSGTTRFGTGQACQLDASRLLNFNVSNLATVYMGMAFYVQIGGAVSTQLLTFVDTATVQTSIYYDLAGTNQLKVYRGTNAGTLLATSTSTFVKGAWHYIEVKCTTNPSIALGDYKVYVDGNLEINLAATTNTRASANSYVNVVRPGSAITSSFIDDFYVSDSQNYLTQPRVYTLYPDTNGNSSQWTNSAGTSVNNYSYVNSTLAQVTTYSAGTTVGDKDVYSMAGLPYVPDNIYGIQNLMYANKDNAGTKTGRLITRSGGTDYEGSDLSMLDSVTYFREVRETDPATSAAWTNSGISNFQLGCKVQA